MFATDTQHFFMFIGLLYFGVQSLPVSFSFYADKSYKVYYPVANILFFVYPSVLSAAFGHTGISHFNVVRLIQMTFLLLFSLLL